MEPGGVAVSISYTIKLYEEVRAAFSYSKEVTLMSKESRIAHLLETGGLSQRSIAERLKVSRNLVQLVRKRMDEDNLTAADIDAMSEEQRSSLFKRIDLPPKADFKESVYYVPDWESVAGELMKPGVTRQLLWEEYCDECRACGKIPYKLTQFKFHLSRFLEKKEYSEVIFHKPGHMTEVDWVGDRAHWADPDSGEILFGYLFVGILAFSGYAYAEVFPDMKEPNWIAAHVHMFEYFGGVTKVLRSDNLKTGVIENQKGKDFILTKEYEALGNHYDLVVIPADAYKPKHKPHAENMVRQMETELLARMRNYQCFSIQEYNQELHRHLENLNNKPFQKKEGSRRSAFEEYEHPVLKPLPRYQYEYCETKTAKVQTNCFIAYKKNFYSVPYKYISETVTLRIYSSRLEVWYGKEKLCEHSLVNNRIGQYVKDNDHFPPYSSNYGDWNSDRFRRWARAIGPATYEVIDKIFENGPEQVYYNGARSLLKLADQYSRERVETACQLALIHYKRPRYRNIKAILEHGQDIQSASVKDTTAITDEKAYVRGAAYYGRKK